MTSPDRDYDDIVRRALHAIVDPIEPSGDGLTRIRERVAQPWLRRQVSLLRAECVDIGWLIVTRCEPAVARARSGLATGGRAASKRLSVLYSYVVVLVAGALAALSRRWRAGGHRTSSARAGGTGVRAQPGWARRAWAWLATPTPWARPALLIAGVTVVVAALALSMPVVRGPLISLMNGGGGTSAGSGGGGQEGPPGVAGPGLRSTISPGGVVPSGRDTESPGGPGYRGTSGSGRGSPTSTCPPSPGAQPSLSPSPSQSASPSSSPTDTGSPTGTPTTTSASGTPFPAGSVSAVKGRGGGGSASAAASATVGAPCSPSPSPQPSPSGTGGASPSTSPTPPTGITTPPTPPSTPPPGTGPPSP